MGSRGRAPLILNLVNGLSEWSVSRLGSFILVERAPDTHWIEGWLSLRNGLDVSVKK
jgi:hypothetical protein